MAEITDEQLKKAVDAIFAKYDKDKNNTLDASEIQGILKNSFEKVAVSREPTQEDIQKFQKIADKNGDNKITKTEFY